MSEIYVSVDIETDGPSPGKHSLMSIGAAAFVRGVAIPKATFEINLQPEPGAVQDPDTMAWWASQDPKVYAHATQNALPAQEAIAQFVDWVKRLPGSPVLVTYPTWDAAWLTYYIGKYHEGKNPFGIGSLDIKSLAMGALNVATFKGTTKKAFPREWFMGTPHHSHEALQDAIGQGMLLVRILDSLS